MPILLTILTFVLVQGVFAVGVVVVLKKALDRELMDSALEKLEACPIADGTREITIYSARALSDEWLERLESIGKRKMPRVNLTFKENAGLKGGIVIAAGDELLDFSLFGRLQQFWS